MDPDTPGILIALEGARAATLFVDADSRGGGEMRRREFLNMMPGLVLAWPFAARAQQTARVPAVGVLAPHLLDPAFPGLVEQLRDLGYEDGRTVRLLIRSAETKLEQLPHLAAELVRTKVDVIVAINTPASREAIAATKDIPIIMVAVGNPVATGFVSNLARPGGNVTGISNMSGDLASKKLAILKEALPASKRIAVLFNPDDPVTAAQIPDTRQAAQRLPIEVRFFAVRSQPTLTAAFKELTDWGADGLMWLAGQHQSFMKATVELAARHRLAAMVVTPPDVRMGGLIAYAADNGELFRRIAVYVDRVLKGTRPGDLPVEQPTKFQLAINLKTAKALGLTIPPTLLARADEVIE
jgi:putative tryptophan/tyrosine transport system substrate-binding protein